MSYGENRVKLWWKELIVFVVALAPAYAAFRFFHGSLPIPAVIFILIWASITSSRKRRQRKKLITLIVTVICVYGSLTVWALLTWRRSAWRAMTPKVRTYLSIKEAGKEEKEEMKKLLRVEIPESAKEIYFLQSRQRDQLILCSFTLPPEEIEGFAQEFTGVALTEFKDYREFEFRGSGVAVAGPTIWGEKWETPYWNIRDFQTRLRLLHFETQERFPGWTNFMLVDPESNRVYLGMF